MYQYLFLQEMLKDCGYIYNIQKRIQTICTDKDLGLI
jgi:hypothetical protein